MLSGLRVWFEIVRLLGCEVRSCVGGKAGAGFLLFAV